jgi:hypothetical protein
MLHQKVGRLSAELNDLKKSCEKDSKSADEHYLTVREGIVSLTKECGSLNKEVDRAH